MKGNKSYLYLFSQSLPNMSEQKEKYFQRHQTRFLKGPPRKDLYQSAEVKNSTNQPEPKEEAVTQSFIEKPAEVIAEEKTAFSLAANAQDNLRRLIKTTKTDLQSLIRDKILRQDLKKQERRLTKVRNDNKLTVQPDTELSITAINSLIGLAEEYINDVNKEKAQKVAPKSTLRINQQKEIARQLTTIDEQIQINNFAAVKSTIQILLKKYGKDELLQQKLGYLNYMLALNEEYDRQAALIKDLSLYVQKLSTIDIVPESINQSNLTLKNLKKQTTLALNKENKKQQPNGRVVTMINQIDKIGGLLTSYVDSKMEKKLGQTKSKRQLQLEKQLQQKVKSSQFLQQSARYCRDLLQKTAESKEELFKQLESLKKNKKKSPETPYSLMLRLYEIILSQKRQINQVNLYLKAYSQFYIRKTLNAQNLGIQLKKIDEKYAPNQTLGVIKPNLDILINNVQQRERFNKQASSVEAQLKKVKAENLRLEKLVSQNKMVQLPVESEKVDKRKELQQKRVRDAQRLRQEKEEKQIERSLDNIFNNLQEKKWKIAKNSINVFLKRYQESTSPLALKSLQSLNTISNIMQDLESAQVRVTEAQKRQKGNLSGLQKQRQTLSEKLKSSQDYELAIKNLIQSYNQEGFVVKKFFDDVRRDRKKIVQQRYQLLMKLEDPLTVSRQAKLSEVSQKVSLNLSQSNESELQRVRKEMEEIAATLDKEKQKSFMLESKLKQSTKGPQVNKDAEQLLNLAKRIEKGGEWWKFLPKNLKNSTFKHIYNILEKYRENELTIQSLQMFMVNQELLKEEAATLSNAFDSALSLIKPGKEWFEQQFWNKNLANFKGNQNCDKFITCLSELSAMTRLKIDDQKNNYKNEVASYVLQIQNLSNSINDLEKRKDTHTQKSSSKFEESSSKKSPELKTSRKVSRSKEKDREGQVSQAMQEYVQQQRKMLSKIEELQGDKQNLEAKAAAIQNQLIQAERRLDDQRIDYENSRFSAEKVRLQQLQKINQLEGELEISEGRRIEMQNSLDADRNGFSQLEKELLSKLHQFQARQAIHLEQLKGKPQQLNSQTEQRLTSQLNYYREMYGELSKQLQISKEKQQHLLKDNQSLQRDIQILEKKYEADITLNQSAIREPSETNQPSTLEIGSPLKLKPHKVQLKTEKIFQLYLDSEPIRKRDKSNQVTPERSNVQPTPNEGSEVDELKRIIESLQAEIRTLHAQKSQDIERQVISALKNQEIDFNIFLKRFEAEKLQFFMNEILPKRLEQQLALRNQSSTASASNYEFMHNDWIINQFPRLYDERHKRHCPNATLDIQLIVNRRLQEAKDEFYKQNRNSQEETNKKVEQSLIQFQQNTLPLIISQHQQQWEEVKARQWEIKTIQIQQYWFNILEEQKKQSPIHTLESLPQQKVNQKQEIHEIIRRQPTEIEIFEVMRREGSKHILSILIGQQLEKWEQQKTNQWIIEKNKIEAYWEDAILEKNQQWQHQKQKEITQIKLDFQQENDRKLDERLNQVISKQKQATEAQIAQALGSLNEEQIIQRWKIVHLPIIIESERRFAIEQFIAIDLPHILEQQKTLWITSQQSPDVNSILILEHQRWQQEKIKQIAFINVAFESKLNQIMQAEHAEWQKNKIIEFQKLLTEKKVHQSPTPELEEILQKEHQHWELVKLQEIRSLQLQFETRLNEIERKLNSQIIDYQQKYLNEQNRMVEVEAAAVSRWKNNELPLLLARQRQSCINEFKSKELPKILEQRYKDWETVDLIQLIHTERNHYIVDNIVSQHRKEWEKDSQKQKTESEAKLWELRQFYESELIKQRQQHEQTQVNAPNQNDLTEWQRLKTNQIQSRIKQVEYYWQTVILPQRQDIWRKDQVVIVEQLLSTKIAEVQNTYQQNYIPKIIEEQWKKWQEEYNQRLKKEKEQWLVELPNLLKTGKYNQYLQSYLEAQANQYELQIKKIQAQSVHSTFKIEQLINQVAQYQQRLRENQSRYELSQSKVKSLLNEHDVTIKRTVEESQRLNEELTRSRWAEKEVQDLRKIIEMQKAEVSKLTGTVREGQRLKFQNINLQQANNNLQKIKWQQINDLKTNYQTKIIELSSERNGLQSKVSQLQGKKDGTDKEALLSFERQISILTSTIKTKDTEISFLKKTIETANIQLRENREKLNEQLEKRGNSQRSLAELKNIRLELDYQIKYLKDREQSMTKKLDLKDQEMLTLRKKIDLDNDSIEKKLKSSLEYAASYQLKFTELESLLTYKTKEAQALLAQADRLRYENQGLSANSQSLTTDVELYKRQVKQLQTQKIQMSADRERSLDETSRLRQTLVQYEEELKRSTEIVNRLTSQFTTEKARFETEIKRNREEILHLEIEVKDTQRIKRIQMDRAAKLQRQLAEGGRDAEMGEIEVLKKINRDVTDLTAANRQLEMKCLLLENKERITTSASEAINSYLLTQKYTDQLLDYLLKEGVVPNLELYHKFLAESRSVLAAGRGQEYFELWERLLRDLFQLTISCRSEEIRTQAQQLLRLRDEMTEVLQRQIEVSEGDQNQLVEDYKQVLNDIKSLVREYMRTGDDEYLRLLCSSLGIAV